MRINTRRLKRKADDLAQDMTIALVCFALIVAGVIIYAPYFIFVDIPDIVKWIWKKGQRS